MQRRASDRGKYLRQGGFLPAREACRYAGERAPTKRFVLGEIFVTTIVLAGTNEADQAKRNCLSVIAQCGSPLSEKQIIYTCHTDLIAKARSLIQITSVSAHADLGSQICSCVVRVINGAQII